MRELRPEDRGTVKPIRLPLDLTRRIERLASAVGMPPAEFLVRMVQSFEQAEIEAAVENMTSVDNEQAKVEDGKVTRVTVPNEPCRFCRCTTGHAPLCPTIPRHKSLQ